MFCFLCLAEGLDCSGTEDIFDCQQSFRRRKERSSDQSDSDSHW